jgi:hypothetical protein
MENNGLATKIDRPYHLATYLSLFEKFGGLTPRSPAFGRQFSSGTRHTSSSLDEASLKLNFEYQPSGFFKSNRSSTYIHRVPLGKKTHEWIGMYEETVLTYRRRLTQRTDAIFPRKLQKRDPGLSTMRQPGRNCQLYQEWLDLRTSVTIRLNKKDVNADAVDSEHGRKAAEVDSLLIPIDIQIDDEVVTKNVMVYSVTIKQPLGRFSVRPSSQGRRDHNRRLCVCYRQTGRLHADD